MAIADLVAEGHELIGAATTAGLTLRLLGGLAVRCHSPAAAGHRGLQRAYPDIDLACERGDGRKLAAFFSGRNYEANKSFNTLNGDRRQLYYDPVHGRQVDVFVGEFAMNHKIPLSGRLPIDPLTLPLAELFLTKAQIVQLNQKDVLDMYALLLDHPVAAGDAETINVERIAKLCANDWGLYTTTTTNLNLLLARLPAANLEEAPRQLLHHRLTALQQSLSQAPKNTTWRLRAAIGKRLPWYEEVEEVAR